jgi:hypothetical protein
MTKAFWERNHPEGLFEASDGAIWISADDRLTVFRRNK